MRWKNDIFIYFAILLMFSFLAFFSIDAYALVAMLFSLLYIPLILTARYYTRFPMEKKEETLGVGEDVQHFRYMANKALKGNAVAQRDVELRIVNSLVVALSIRYGIPEREIRKNLENTGYMRKYLGERGKVVADMFKRRHDLKTVLPRERFLKEINEVMEAMK